MKKIYDDYQILSQEKCIELKNAYDLKLNSVKGLNSDNSYLHLAHICVDSLQEAKHFVENMKNNSKNRDMHEKLDLVIDKIAEIISKITHLYIITENEGEKTNYNNNLNLVTAIDKLLNSMQTMLQLIEIETNKKVVDSLITLAFQTIELIRKLNGFIVFCNYKILKFI